MNESNYKLRKRITELEEENKRLRLYKDAVLRIFDLLTKCKGAEYYQPMVIMKELRSILWSD